MGQQLDKKQQFFRDFIGPISDAKDIVSACGILEDYLNCFEYKLLSVKFCDSKDELPAVRCFGNYSCEIKELSEKLRERGGCPMTREAIRLLQPFDALNINNSRYPDFLSRRFLQELQKTGHNHIAVIPIALNRGIAMFSIGLEDHKFAGSTREFLVCTISQVTILLITKFPELTTLFAPKSLNSLQVKCLMLYSNGINERQIGNILGLNEMTVHTIIDASVEKLNARNRAHAAAKAVRLGEFLNLF